MLLPRLCDETMDLHVVSFQLLRDIINLHNVKQQYSKPPYAALTDQAF